MSRSARYVVLALFLLTAAEAFPGPQTSGANEPFKIYAFGHSHMDPAWRWRWWEGQDFVLDTFNQAVAFMQEMPSFHYVQSQAALYAYVEEKDPELFEKVREFVRKGQWQVVGGSWVENDANLPSGEALVRQFLVGQRYFREKFGVEAETGWEPDCFGHTWSLPQILRKSHIQRYVMLRGGKGRPTFTWEGADGTRIPTVDLGAVLPALEDAFEDFQRLGLKASARKMVDRLRSSGLVSVILPFGVGDHGGGPTREMILGLHAVGRLPFVDVLFSSPDSAVRAYLAENGTGAIVRDELNYDDYTPDKPVRFVFQGCYSSHMRMKQRNYRDVVLLTTAEKLGALAEQLTGYNTPVDSLEAAWKVVLFNQFHDLLPGTAIHRAFEDAHRNYDRAERAILQALDAALDSLTDSASYPTEGYPVAVFNALGRPRTDVTSVILDFARIPARIVLTDAQGDTTPGQILEGMKVYEQFWRLRIGFVAHDVPAVGYKTFAVRAFDSKGRELPVLDVLREPTLAAWHPEIFDDHTYWKPGAQLLHAKLDTTRSGNLLLGAAPLRVELDPRTGGIVRLQDSHGREYAALNEPMARLELLGDNPGGYTAWRMRLTGFDTLLVPNGKPQLLSRGPVCTKVRVPYAFGSSRFLVDITTYTELPRVDVDVHSYWRERLKTLKAVFPVAVQAGTHTRAIPFAAIQRPNDGLEEPAQRWVDVTGPGGGVAILNRNNPGHDVKGHTVRVTVLRSPIDPDPVADVGEHHARLSIYPHSNSLAQADPQSVALQLSTPLLARVPHRRAVANRASRASLVKLEEPGVTLAALKHAVDGNGWIVRLVERIGQSHQNVTVTFAHPLVEAREVDLIEDPVGPVNFSGHRLTTTLQPYEIRTFRVRWEE
ncbi:MAG: alpha-mannosidase [Calditrichaeota bacterium]|nr:alpha-mannosidase [Calditrichota bacterium]